MLSRKLLPGNQRRNLHRLTHIHNVLDQVGKAHLNQPYNGRTRRGNQRPGQIRLAKLFSNGPRHHIRTAGNLEYIVEAHLPQTGQDLRNVPQILELPVQRGRGQGDFVFEPTDGGKRIGHGNLGVIIADADALAAVNAALVNNVRPSAAHANSLGGAALQTVGAAPAFILFQPDGVKSLLFRFHTPETSSLREHR